MNLYNTLTRRKEDFKPVGDDYVRLYTCGLTVYNYAHIGNLRTYFFEDILRRTLEYFNYRVRHVMNVTDVGHLESDADSGEDKLVLGARREGKTPAEIARFYEKIFFEDLAAMNILKPHVICRASEHIDDMIEFVKALIEKQFAYEVEGNVYFSVERFPEYGRLSGMPVEDRLAGARIEIDPNKRHPGDFALWLSKSKFPNQIMQWDSPWGRGFPGWHIECTVMAIKYLGARIDIHCGGVDHIAVHHTNEIAQAEAYLGHKWCSYWLHGEWLVVAREKMSKSKGGFLDLRAIAENGYGPMHLRYLYLTAHYRQPLEFSYESLDAAKNAYENLNARIIELKEMKEPADSDQELKAGIQAKFRDAIADDLNMPATLALAWKTLKDNTLSPRDRINLIEDFDRILGLNIAGFARRDLPDDCRLLILEREKARDRKEFHEADRIRDLLAEKGIGMKDTPRGTDWYWLR